MLKREAPQLKRRQFITLLGGAAAAWPLAARAQQAAKVWRIGVLETISAQLNATNFEALRKGLRDLGYIEGQNLTIEYRSADGQVERFPQLAEELVRAQVDVIVTRRTPAVFAAKTPQRRFPWSWPRAASPLPPVSFPGSRSQAAM
jgi:putative tryptophan/tyrosine transport system substrate-binding protein